MIVPAGVPVGFAVTFDMDNLNVAMVIYDITGSVPVLVLPATAMAFLYGATYFGKFTPAHGKSYVAMKAVYTDNTFTTLDAAYIQVSEAFMALYQNPQTQSIIGVVECEGA